MSRLACDNLQAICLSFSCTPAALPFIGSIVLFVFRCLYSPARWLHCAARFLVSLPLVVSF